MVAPTSFITSTSRRRAKIESRIVFAISAHRGDREQDHQPDHDLEHGFQRAQHAIGVFLPYVTHGSCPQLSVAGIFRAAAAVTAALVASGACT